MQKKFLHFLLSFLIINIILTTITTPLAAKSEAINPNLIPPDINADSYILIDLNSGNVLAEKNPDKPLHPASTTKMMTAIVALETNHINQIMTATKNAINSIGPGGMNIGIMEGEEISFEDLLNAMLINSANETSYIIAESTSNSVEEFVALMNKRTSSLGALNTNFVNPCGMDTKPTEESHMSTARDLALIAKHGMSMPKFREIVRKTRYNIKPTNKHPNGIPVTTTNKLLYSKSTYYKEITGIKTGFTNRAGFNLVSSAINKDGMELIAVVLGVKNQPSEKICDYSKQLLEFGFQNYKIQNIVDTKKIIARTKVKNAKNNQEVNIVASDPIYVVLPLDKKTWDLKIHQNINKNIHAPIKKGQILGYIEYTRNGILIGKSNLVANSDIENNVSNTSFYIILLVVIGYSLYRFLKRKLLSSWRVSPFKYLKRK